jgi:hypothetical protein
MKVDLFYSLYMLMFCFVLLVLTLQLISGPSVQTKTRIEFN